MEELPDLYAKIDVEQLCQGIQESWKSLTVGAINTNRIRLHRYGLKQPQAAYSHR